MKGKSHTMAPKRRGNGVRATTGSSSATRLGPKKGKMPKLRK